jgi:hypothetical protein
MILFSQQSGGKNYVLTENTGNKIPLPGTANEAVRNKGVI